MLANLEKLDTILDELKPYNAVLVAVSKKKPAAAITIAYNHGQRDFGENYVQELLNKRTGLPGDIRWHFIGHLQSNKVKQIAPFVNLIHGIDSPELASEVNRHSTTNNRTIEVLLQVHISGEETKFGFSPHEVMKLMDDLISIPYTGITIRGLMGMASFTDDLNQVRNEFKSLKKLYDSIRGESVSGITADFNILSMGMTNDYKIALEEGSNMVRIGSAIFGDRGK